MQSAPTPALVSQRPYRWGKFQGWVLIICGLVMAGTVLVFLSRPNNEQIRGFVVGFSEASGFGREILSRFESGDVGYALGMLLAYLLQTVGTGIGLLKKRKFGLVLFLLLTVRAVASLSVVPIVWTLGSLPYYYKRWREFRAP